ncbi:Sterol esterase [Coniochaeta hoffmannii]|uniref:Sterol esterase n=1 Tax=Coniochaeta hoffmannii TaxID=91930 RepID=A0AA38RK86_9PEZI|nr:Sterol esterase [Coniochaeta hoffmannii]
MTANETPPQGRDRSPNPSTTSKSSAALGRTAVEFAKQAEKLSHQKPEEGERAEVAVEAHFVTEHDPVIVTSEGNRLPTVPLEEAHKLNILKEELVDGEEAVAEYLANGDSTEENGGEVTENGHSIQTSAEGNLRRAMPPSHTNPLFPPLPLYGPPSVLRDVQCVLFRISSHILSTAFLAVIVLGAIFTSIGPVCRRLWMKATLRDPDADRPFYKEELRRKSLRKSKERAWKRMRGSIDKVAQDEEDSGDEYIPTEGGPDPIKCDVGYYARRVGLDVEEFQVQTEDGFIIDLWHVFDPKEYTALPAKERAHRGPEIFTDAKRPTPEGKQGRKKRFPVLLIHGLLQSAGAYCVNDDDSLAFYLCKAGYDVWLGNNRCGFQPKHVLLEYGDPRMWCWNIRQFGVFDLPALTSRVRYETGFDKIGLVAHSQGTTQTLVALAKEQRPDLGEKLTVFCALAPAAYAGPLIGKMYFKFMRVITPAMFRMMFGIHAFIPLMMTMHRLLPPKLYGRLGYLVFAFLFNWTDARWDRGLRDRMFQFAPVYVSAESMRWWLGRECFARHKCILATKEEWRAEDREDTAESDRRHDVLAEVDRDRGGKEEVKRSEMVAQVHRRHPKGSTAWYNEQAPPFALWVAGNDALVDGEKLLRRFERGREPYVDVVHQKVIPGYEHLDVIWAMDAVEKVFKELKEVLWKTCDVRDECRVPKGCGNVEQWKRPKREAGKEESTESSSSSSSNSSGSEE